MTSLTSLTLSEARDGLRAKKFSAREIADAHIAAIERARGLNAFVLETPERARAMAAESDARLAEEDGARAGEFDQRTWQRNVVRINHVDAHRRLIQQTHVDGRFVAAREAPVNQAAAAGGWIVEIDAVAGFVFRADRERQQRRRDDTARFGFLCQCSEQYYHGAEWCPVEPGHSGPAVSQRGRKLQ